MRVLPDLALERWADSGMMALTGFDDAPLGPPAALVEEVDRLGARFAGLDALGLLAERAALTGLHRRGTTSCGGSCRILRAADGYVAVSLPRDDDLATVPAWLELDIAPDDAEAVWEIVARVVADRARGEVVARAILLGLPVAGLGEKVRSDPVRCVRLGTAPPGALRDRLVIDLSTMWAGPLCGDLLASQGATVIKVESVRRPDGARRGPPEFFDLLNGTKQSVALDLEDPAGMGRLRGLLERADVVIESARPRALEQLGLCADQLVAEGGPQLWVSITGYGRTGEGRHRTAFGDDAAVAGGLVSICDRGPVFCGDAIADPLAGLAAATACLERLEAGGRWAVDVSMAAVAASLAGPTLEVSEGVVAGAPRARAALAHAPRLGADTDEVLARLGITA